MLKYVVAMLCGVSLSGSVYMAGWGSQAKQMTEDCPACMPDTGDSKTMVMDMTGKTDMKNTKCIVMSDDIGSSKTFVEYKGTIYHTCCNDCVATFKKDPEKYVKAIEADPAKFGVKK